MSVIGVDPGLSGAIATYGDGQLDVIDMPTFKMQVGRTIRKRVDAVALIEHFEMQKMLGAELVVIEAVGGRPKQGASGAFVLGYIVGLVYMACVAVRLPIDTIQPAVWKRVMRMPGKKAKGLSEAENNNAIFARGLEILPDHVGKFTGPQGGKRIDRIEAAMLAVYGERHVLGSVQPDAEWRLSYQKADTGA